MRRLRKMKAAGLAAAAVMMTSGAALAADPALICEAGKLKVSSSYAACVLKAESTAVLKGLSVDTTKCDALFNTKFPATETKAGPMVCPSEGDVADVKNFLDVCMGDVTASLAGGVLPLDPDACAAALTSTNADLGICNSDLSSTNADLTDCLDEPEAKTIKTGQTTCYNTAGTVIPCAGTGQDGETQRGVASSYTDNGDGTITDNKTGLMWEKLDDDNLPGLAGIHDWDHLYTWANAFVKVSDLNGSAFAGHADWRLPNLRELESLKDIGLVGPAIDPKFNTACVPGCTTAACSCTQSNSYWSSSTYQTSPTGAWGVDFYDGLTYGNSKTSSLYVRGVRAGS